MYGLLLLSHSDLSKSFYETLELIMGQTNKDVSYIVLPYGQDMDEYKEKIETKVEEVKRDGILILTDLFGGSPSMMAARIYEKYHDTVPMEIVCGTSLPMVMEAVSAMNHEVSLSKCKELVIEAGHQGIIDFTGTLNKALEKKGGSINEYQNDSY